MERGHKPIVDALMKYCDKDPSKWPKFLDLVLWAERITVKRPTRGSRPFYVCVSFCMDMIAHCQLRLSSKPLGP